MPEMIGSGLNDDIGNASRMSSQVERDTAPMMTVNRAALSIVNDTLELSLVNIGAKNLWTYLSSETHPTLSHPLESVRTASNLSEIQSRAWEAYYETLKELMDLSVRDRLNEELKKPTDEKSPEFMALNDVLVTTAKMLVIINASVRTDDPLGKKAQDILSNSQIGTVMGNNLVVTGNQFLKGAMDFLDSVGANYAHYDKLSNNLKQFEAGLNKLQTLMKNDLNAISDLNISNENVIKN